MRDRTRLELLGESNRAMGSMIIWFAVFVVASLVMAFNWKNLSVAGAIIIIATISVSLFVMVLYAFRYARLNGMMRDDDDEEPPANNASDILNFRIEHPEPTIRLETSDKNQIKLGRYEYSQVEWKAIYNALKDADWHWNRKNVAAAGVIKSITAQGVFPAFQKELVKIRVLDLTERKITPGGRAALRNAAGIRTVTP